MYKLVITSISPYIDGSKMPKISAQVMGMFDDATLITREVVVDVGAFAGGLDLQLVEPFILDRAREHRELNLANLQAIKSDMDARAAAEGAAQTVVDAINEIIPEWPISVVLEEDANA